MLKSKATYVSFLIALSLVVFIYLKGESDLYYSLLKYITETALSLFPNLLGFCIGGYALIIGASNMNILKKMSRPLTQRNKMSFFQVLSSIFAVSLIIQCFTLLFAYILHIIMQLEITAPTMVIGEMINLLLIFLMLLCSVMSMLLLYYTIINIFNFGQSVHFCIRLDESNDNKKVDTNV